MATTRDRMHKEILDKIAGLPKTRAKGLKKLVDRYSKLKEEMAEVWDVIYKSCTHCEKDLEYDTRCVDDTLGNTRGYEDVVFCKVCKRQIARHYLSASRSIW